jgi:hypothetical protein
VHAIARLPNQYHIHGAGSDESHATKHDSLGGGSSRRSAPRQSLGQLGAAAAATSMALPDLFRRVKVVPVRAALARRFSSAHVPK